MREHIERGKDRRREQLPFYEAIVDRRGDEDRRACATPLIWSEPQPGAIRPGAGEVVNRERRQFASAGD